jgi:addiction module HigA family antidote
MLQYAPDFVSCPGETLAEVLQERGLSKAEPARRTGFTPTHVNRVVKGRARISPEFALALEAALGTPANFWLVRDAHYQLHLARQAAGPPRGPLAA